MTDFTRNPLTYTYTPSSGNPVSSLVPLNSNFMAQDVLDVPLLTGGTNSSALPSSIFNYMRDNKAQSFLSPQKTGTSLASPRTGGFFGNGNDFGFNLDTANFAMNGLNGIMQLWGANTQRKAMQAQMDLAKENMLMTKRDFYGKLESKTRGAINFNGGSPEDMRVGGNAVVSRYGGEGVLKPRELAPARRDDQSTASIA